MISRFLRSTTQRLLAACAVIGGSIWAAMTMGGVIGTATVIVSATYVGTLLTVSRVPKEVPAEAGRIKTAVLKPVVAVRNWLFNHPLVLTIGLGVLSGLTTGITTVTGVACLAISALLGDVIVAGFLDGLRLWENPQLRSWA